MIPFRWSKGGGSQDISRVLESIAVITTPSGANVGAATNISNQRDNGQPRYNVYLKMFTLISHLSKYIHTNSILADYWVPNLLYVNLHGAISDALTDVQVYISYTIKPICICLHDFLCFTFISLYHLLKLLLSQLSWEGQHQH